MSEGVQIDMPDIVAGPGTEYRVKRYIFIVLMFGFGVLCVRDGFYRWPKEQTDFAAATPERQSRMEKPHNDASILLQKGLAVLFTTVAPAMLVFMLYNSRGEIRLAGNVLHAPGHPPVPLDRITQLDKTAWDRKGIAYAEYQGESGAGTKRIRLDNFVYKFQPINAIVDRIDADLDPSGRENVAPEGTGESNETARD